MDSYCALKDERIKVCGDYCSCYSDAHDSFHQTLDVAKEGENITAKLYKLAHCWLENKTGTDCDQMQAALPGVDMQSMPPFSDCSFLTEVTTIIDKHHYQNASCSFDNDLTSCVPFMP